MSIFDDLARRNSPAVKAALREKCPVCKAIPGEDCTNLPINGFPLQNRLVHYARATG